jgi:hypothetical protein
MIDSRQAQSARRSSEPGTGKLNSRSPGIQSPKLNRQVRIAGIQLQNFAIDATLKSVLRTKSSFCMG